MKSNKEVKNLIRIARIFYEKNWFLGTSGNLSYLLSREPLQFVITASSVDKGNLTPRSFVKVESWSGEGSDEVNGLAPKPSGETILHTTIYQHAVAGSIIHVHSPQSLLIAELFLAEGEFTFSQFEIQKGLGFSDISEACRIPILQNKTDLNLLAEDIAARVQPDHIGLLVEKHGLFVWGKSIVDVQRHTELLHHMFEYVLLKNEVMKRK